MLYDNATWRLYYSIRGVPFSEKLRLPSDHLLKGVSPGGSHWDHEHPGLGVCLTIVKNQSWMNLDYVTPVLDSLKQYSALVSSKPDHEGKENQKSRVVVATATNGCRSTELSACPLAFYSTTHETLPL
ncbi:hypothetical protein EVAR_65946_1 [Eumeta japonica]|uniref:Uncharacterized protein n=1 Tax=Eumeta variegata TaxID=151549 RepID=A0A4C1ZLI9_EUMVA|nr:hypothetical protein EVAR_65946_1 [Eumeta japonica]